MVADFRGVVVQGNVAHERLAQINVARIEQSCHELPKMGQSIGAQFEEPATIDTGTDVVFYLLLTILGTTANRRKDRNGIKRD